VTDDEGTWDLSAAGVLRLPSGRLLRGRGLRQPMLDDALPQFGLYLQGTPPPPVGWPSRWVRWPDWRLPVDRDDAEAAFREAWKRATAERVEVACTGGCHWGSGAARLFSVAWPVDNVECVNMYYVRDRGTR
jgi:hypothetical protein